MKSFLKINFYLFLFLIFASANLFAETNKVLIQSETGKYISPAPSNWAFKDRFSFTDNPAEAIEFELKPVGGYAIGDAVRYNTPLFINVSGTNDYFARAIGWVTARWPKDKAEQWVIVPKNDSWDNKDIVKRNELVRIETLTWRTDTKDKKEHGMDLCAKGDTLMHTQDFRFNRNRTDIPDQKIFWKLVTKAEAIDGYAKSQTGAIKGQINSAVAQNQFEFLLGEIGKLPTPPQDIKDLFFAKIKEKEGACSISFLTKVSNDPKLGLTAPQKTELTNIINKRKAVIEKEGISFAENIAIKSKDGKYLKPAPNNLLALAAQVDDDIKFEISSLDKKKNL